MSAAFLAIGASVIVSACVKSSPPVQVKEAPPPPQQEAPVPTREEINAQKQAMAALPAPTSAEVLDTLKRVYQDVLVAEAEGSKFVVGDFNGDLSQDIAIVAKPAKGKLSEINDELANWILGDVLSTVLPDPLVKVREASTGNPAAQLPQVVEDEVLLAVFHGHEAGGWRNPEAQQSYLLKHAVGSGMKTFTPDEVKAAWKTGPPLEGDVITQKLAGGDGFLFYGHGVYNWFDPKRFKARRAPKMIHVGGEVKR